METKQQQLSEIRDGLWLLRLEVEDCEDSELRAEMEKEIEDLEDRAAALAWEDD